MIFSLSHIKRLSLVLALGFSVFLAQSMSKSHDVEHAHHEAQAQCIAFAAFANDADIPCLASEFAISPTHISYVSHSFNPVSTRLKYNDTIRAPPMCLS